MENRNHVVVSTNNEVQGHFSVYTSRTDDIGIQVGNRICNGMVFTKEYILDNMDEFMKLARFIEITVEDAGDVEEVDDDNHVGDPS